MPSRAGSTFQPCDRAAVDLTEHCGAGLQLRGDLDPSQDLPLVVLIDDGHHTTRFDDLGCAVAWLDPWRQPHDTVDELVTRTRSAIGWLLERPDHGYDNGRMIVIGRGAGAHLAAMVAVHDPRPAAYVLVSGVYEIDDTGRHDARHLSPLRLIGASEAECVVAWANDDAATIRHQGQAWAATWSMTEWNRPATAVEVHRPADRDLIDELVDPDTPLGAILRRLLAP